MERTRNVDVHDTNADHRTAGHSTADHSRDNDTPDNDTNAEGFAASRLLFAGLCTFLDGKRAGALDHGALEEALAEQGRELLRQLYQDYLGATGIRSKGAIRRLWSRRCAGAVTCSVSGRWGSSSSALAWSWAVGRV